MKTLLEIWNDLGGTEPFLVKNNNDIHFLCNKKIAEGFFQGKAVDKISGSYQLTYDIIHSGNEAIWQLITEE